MKRSRRLKDGEEQGKWRQASEAVPGQMHKLKIRDKVSLPILGGHSSRLEAQNDKPYGNRSDVKAVGNRY
jgi:hypothetical protein